MVILNIEDMGIVGIKDIDPQSIVIGIRDTNIQELNIMIRKIKIIKGEIECSVEEANSVSDLEENCQKLQLLQKGIEGDKRWIRCY